MKKSSDIRANVPLATSSNEGTFFQKIHMFSERVSDVLWKFIPFRYDSPNKKTGFQRGIGQVIAGVAMSVGAMASPSFEPLVPSRPSQNKAFEPLCEPVKKIAKFTPGLPVTILSEHETEKPLSIETCTETSMRPPASIKIERETNAYKTNGEFAECLPKGTRVEFFDRPLIADSRGKTYALIIQHDNTPDGTLVIERYWVRTPGFDSLAQKEKKPFKTGETKTGNTAEKTPNAKTATAEKTVNAKAAAEKTLNEKTAEKAQAAEKAKTEAKTVNPSVNPRKKSIFHDNYSYRSDPIPPEAVELATRRYLGTVLIPQIRGSIAKNNTELVGIREQVKKEYLLNKVPIEKIPSYASQKAVLAKKQSLIQLNYAMESFVVNGAKALVQPDVEKLLVSLKKMPGWNDILLRATAAVNEDKKLKRQRVLQKYWYGGFEST